MNTKGSISISINMIVVVVLAFVMLGLMLTLGRSIVNQAQEGALNILGGTQQEIEKQLVTSNQPLYFADDQFEVEFAQRIDINFGVKNVDPATKNLKIQIEYIDPASGNPTGLAPSTTSTTNYGSFFWPVNAAQYGPGEGKALSVQYRAPSARGTHLFNFKLVDAGNGDALVSEQVIFINII